MSKVWVLMAWHDSSGNYQSVPPCGALVFLFRGYHTFNSLKAQYEEELNFLLPCLFTAVGRGAAVAG